jgi:hypothetical protein
MMVATNRSGRGVGVPSRELVYRLEDAFQARNWQRLRSLYHDEALLATDAAGGEYRGPDHTIALLKAAAADGLYDAGVSDVTSLGADAALVWGHLRRRSGARGWSAQQTLRLFTFKDELLIPRRHLRLGPGGASLLQRKGRHAGHGDAAV